MWVNTLCECFVAWWKRLACAWILVLLSTYLLLPVYQTESGATTAKVRIQFLTNWLFLHRYLDANFCIWMVKQRSRRQRWLEWNSNNNFQIKNDWQRPIWVTDIDKLPVIGRVGSYSCGRSAIFSLAINISNITTVCITSAREHCLTSWGEVSLHSWPPVWQVRIQLLCFCWIRSLAESKPVKQEVSRTVILPLTSVLCLCHPLLLNFCMVVNQNPMSDFLAKHNYTTQK